MELGRTGSLKQIEKKGEKNSNERKVMKVIERGKEVADLFERQKGGTGKEESKSETSSSFVMKRR